MKKLNHIRIFENFSTDSMGSGPAQLLVTGDWTGITRDGKPLDFVAPATFIFEYLPAGSPVPSGYEKEYVERPYTDLGDIAEESFGGDQNGVNVAPKNYSYMRGANTQLEIDMRKGILRLFIDPTINPSELESYLRKECDSIFSIASDKEYYMVDDCDSDIFEPEYWRLAMADRPFRRKVVFE